MAILDMSDSGETRPLIATSLVLGLIGLLFYLLQKPKFATNAPKMADDAWPILGAYSFFTKRWEFFTRAASLSHTGNFSFYAGQWPVIGVTGEEGRKAFFDSKFLDPTEGHKALMAGAPSISKGNNPFAEDIINPNESAWYIKRLAAVLKGHQLERGLEQILLDAREDFDNMASNPAGMTDPFDSIYRMIFHVSMRTLACKEIADDPVLLDRCLYLFENVESNISSFAIMFPWLPLPSRAKRTYAGFQMYMIFKRIVDDRKRTGRREDDALQFLLDQGDDLTHIITFVIGSLFAGQINSGFSAANCLCQLAKNKLWTQRARDEIEEIADRYCPDKTIPLKDRLMRLPLRAWDELPVLDLCLKDTLRLQLSGLAFRKNISNQDVAISKTEAISPGTFSAYYPRETHFNPEIYPNPEEWDPSRYLPERAEDKKQQYAWMGWGAGRHLCPGMQFAKLENNIIIALFLAYFDDFDLTDEAGHSLDKAPQDDPNAHTALKPEQNVYLKFHVRDANLSVS